MSDFEVHPIGTGARLTRGDRALNNLHRQSIEPSFAERVVTWAAIGLCAFCALYFGLQLVRGVL